QRLLLLLAGELDRWLMGVAVVANLVSSGMDTCAELRICRDRVAGSEPGSLDAMLRQQGQDTLGSDGAKLALRDGGWARHASGKPEGQRIEVEGQADKMPGHTYAPFSGVSIGCHSEIVAPQCRL